MDIRLEPRHFAIVVRHVGAMPSEASDEPSGSRLLEATRDLESPTTPLSRSSEAAA